MTHKISAGTHPETHFLMLAITLVAGFLVSHDALAQWRFAPVLSAGLEYDDNATLSNALLQESAEGYLIDAQAKFSFTDERTNFWITPRIQSTNYNNRELLDSNDQFLHFDFSRLGLVSNVRFRGEYGRESIRTAERFDTDLDLEDPDAIPDDDTGSTFETKKRQRIQLIPEWRYRFNEKSSIRTIVRYLDTSYEDDTANQLNDFTDGRIYAYYEHAFSERNSGVFGGYVRRYDSTESDRKFSGYGLTAGFNRDLSERTQFIVNVGVDATENQLAEKQNNAVGDVSIVHRLETARVLASYRRTVSGGGSGVLSVRDSISLNLTRDFTERFAAGIGIRAYRTQALDKDIINFDGRDYYQLRGLLTWRMSRSFSTDLDYRYTSIDRSELNQRSDSNQVRLWLRYHPIL